LSATKPFQTWHHVVGAFNGTHTLVYVDGVFIGNDALAGLGAGDYRVMVGNNIGNLTEPLYGAVAECAVYQFGLSATQVANHFNAIEVAVTAPPLFQLGGVVGVGVGLCVAGGVVRGGGVVLGAGEVLVRGAVVAGGVVDGSAEEVGDGFGVSCG